MKKQNYFLIKLYFLGQKLLIFCFCTKLYVSFCFITLANKKVFKNPTQSVLIFTFPQYNLKKQTILKNCALFYKRLLKGVKLGQHQTSPNCKCGTSEQTADHTSGTTWSMRSHSFG